MGRSLTLACVMAVAATSCLTSAAYAESGRLAVDWGRLLVDLDAYARHGGERANALAPQGSAVAAERTTQLYLHTAGNAWFGVAPHVSLVARDWGSSYRISGDQLSLVDAMRLTNSTRMVMSRVRLGDLGANLVTPFAQVGFGQWRTDSKFLPFTPNSTEIAAQVGGGVELHVARRWHVACETAATMFIRDEREIGDLPQTRLWSTTIASRLDW